MNKRSFEEMAASPESTGLPHNTASLLTSGQWSDMKIKCFDREWKLHRVVVFLQSGAIAKSLEADTPISHRMRNEAKTGITDLDNEHSDIVENMIQFMYTGDYQAQISEIYNPDGTPDKPVPSYKIHTDVFILAEEQEVPALKLAAVKKFKACFGVFMMVDQAHFRETLQKIFERTADGDRMLLDAAMEYAGSHLKELMKRDDMIALWKKHGEIGYEMWKAYTIAEDKAAAQPSVPENNARPSGLFSDVQAHSPAAAAQPQPATIFARPSQIPVNSPFAIPNKATMKAEPTRGLFGGF